MNFDNETKQIVTSIKSCLNKSDLNVFSELDSVFRNYFERSVNSITEMRKRSEKNKGLMFEVFCKLWLKYKGYEAFLLSECSKELLDELGLAKQDVGIDIIAKIVKKDQTVLWFAVQCKYRSPKIDHMGRTVHRVTWKDISTFISLCTRTGKLWSEDSKGSQNRSWTSHIIMTNADSVSWKGKKTKKDRTIAKKTFNKLPKLKWIEFLKSITGEEEKIEPQKKVDIEEIRQLRNKWLENISK